MPHRAASPASATSRAARRLHAAAFQNYPYRAALTRTSGITVERLAFCRDLLYGGGGLVRASRTHLGMLEPAPSLHADFPRDKAMGWDLQRMEATVPETTPAAMLIATWQRFMLSHMLKPKPKRSHRPCKTYKDCDADPQMPKPRRYPRTTSLHCRAWHEVESRAVGHVARGEVPLPRLAAPPSSPYRQLPEPPSL